LKSLVRIPVENVGETKPIQAEYESSIPFTRSSQSSIRVALEADPAGPASRYCVAEGSPDLLGFTITRRGNSARSASIGRTVEVTVARDNGKSLMGSREMLKLVLAAGWIITGTCGALAQSSSDAEKSAATELSGEMLECSVYFRIAATCMQGVPDTRVPQTIRELNKNASKIGELAISTGATAGVTVEAQQARSTSLHDEMTRSIFNKCHNISILLHRYHNFCLRLIDHADLRRAELLQQKK
jgi:hypothetical protein